MACVLQYPLDKVSEENMKTVLFITCNLKPKERSRSLTVADEFLKKYTELNPEDRIEVIDTYRDHIQRFDEDVLNGMEKLHGGMAFAALTSNEQVKLGKIWASAEKFAEADKYVFVTPMWNLNFPVELRMYLDTICVVGKTFMYTEKGPVGLLSGKGKKCLNIHATGGFYYGTPFDFSVPYLKTLMKFIGVEDFSSIVIEGLDILPDRAAEFVAHAIEKAKVEAAVF